MRSLSSPTHFFRQLVYFLSGHLALSRPSSFVDVLSDLFGLCLYNSPIFCKTQRKTKCHVPCHSCIQNLCATFFSFSVSKRPIWQPVAYFLIMLHTLSIKGILHMSQFQWKSLSPSKSNYLCTLSTLSFYVQGPTIHVLEATWLYCFWYYFWVFLFALYGALFLRWTYSSQSLHAALKYVRAL